MEAGFKVLFRRVSAIGVGRVCIVVGGGRGVGFYWAVEWRF